MAQPLGDVLVSNVFRGFELYYKLFLDEQISTVIAADCAILVIHLFQLAFR